MKQVSKVIIFIFACLSFVFHASSSMAIVLPIPNTPQLQTWWCWAASTETTVEFLGRNARQCDMANYLRTALYLGSDDCCRHAQLSLP
jgi:hypothetical protein